MRRKGLYLLGVLCLAGLLSGCASVISLQTPDEFKDMKVKEDPPGTMLPEPHDGVKWC